MRISDFTRQFDGSANVCRFDNSCHGQHPLHPFVDWQLRRAADPAAAHAEHRLGGAVRRHEHPPCVGSRPAARGRDFRACQLDGRSDPATAGRASDGSACGEISNAVRSSCARVSVGPRKPRSADGITRNLRRVQREHRHSRAKCSRFRRFRTRSVSIAVADEPGLMHDPQPVPPV